MNESELFMIVLSHKIAESRDKLKHYERINYYMKYEEMEITNLSVNEALIIINDALSFGFEFIVKDGKILYTEQTF